MILPLNIKTIKHITMTTLELTQRELQDLIQSLDTQIESLEGMNNRRNQVLRLTELREMLQTELNNL